MIFDTTKLIGSMEFELFFLNQVYRLAEHDNSTQLSIEMEYSRSAGEPLRKSFVSASMNIGDWRSGFLQAGAPLVFVTSFKVLDLLIEWLLAENGIKPPLQLNEKYQKLIALTDVPQLFSTSAWLYERICALYKFGAPLRNTLIHKKEFEITTAGLFIKPSKSIDENERVKISSNQLKMMSELILTVVKILTGNLGLDKFREKRIRWLLDGISNIHGCCLLHQKPPRRGKIRLRKSPTEAAKFDLAKLRNDIDPVITVPDSHGNLVALQGDETLFDLEIISSLPDGEISEMYFIPWHQVHKYPNGMNLVVLRAFLVPLDTNSSTEESANLGSSVSR